MLLLINGVDPKRSCKGKHWGTSCKKLESGPVIHVYWKPDYEQQQPPQCLPNLTFCTWRKLSLLSLFVRASCWCLIIVARQALARVQALDRQSVFLADLVVLTRYSKSPCATCSLFAQAPRTHRAHRHVFRLFHGNRPRVIVVSVKPVLI